MKVGLLCEETYCMLLMPKNKLYVSTHLLKKNMFRWVGKMIIFAIFFSIHVDRFRENETEKHVWMMYFPND